MKHLFILFCTAIFIPTLVLVIGLQMTNHAEFTSLHFTSQPMEQFGWEEDEEEDYHLMYLFPLYNQPYVYCEFMQDLSLPETMRGTRHVGYVINIEKGERVFRSEWENIRQGRGERIVRNELFSFYIVEDQISICSGRFLFRRPEWVGHMRNRFFYSWLRTFFYKRSTQFLIHRDDQSYSIKYFQPQSTYSRMSPYPNIMLGSNQNHGEMREYTLDENGYLTVVDQWEESQLPDISFPVGESDYLGYRFENETILYFQREGKNRYHEYTVMEIMALDPTFPASNIPPQSLTMIPAGNESEPMLSISILLPYRVFQFHEPGRNKTTIDQVFSLERRRGTGYPIMTLNKNRVLVVTEENPGVSNPYRPLPDKFLVSYVERKSDQDMFSDEKPKLIQFQNPPLGLSRMPLDDEHILFYRDSGLWKIHWKSGKETKLFPRR